MVKTKYFYQLFILKGKGISDSQNNFVFFVVISACLVHLQGHPEGRPGMSGVSPLSGTSGLSFDSTLLSPLLFFCVILLLFLSFFCLLVQSPELFPENSSIFFIRIQTFLYGSCLATRRSKLVGGMCSMLPYDTGIYCYAFT